MTDADLEQRLRDLRQADLPPSSTRPPIDTAAAWREFQALRSRSVAMRRRSLAVAAIAAAAALAIVFPVLTGTSTGQRPQPASSAGIPAVPRTYPKAVAARIPLSGVMSVVGDAGHAWVLRAVERPGLATTYQLVGIEVRTNAIMFRTDLGRQKPAMAGGDGRLWLTTPYGQSRGQIVRVDLATGQVLSTIHVSAAPIHEQAGRCTQLSYSAGMLYAACQVNGPFRHAFWNIIPSNEKAHYLGGIVRGNISSLVAAPDALWYVHNYTQLNGLAYSTGHTKYVSARHAGFWDQLQGGQDLVYDNGSIWALSGAERLIRIDPLTGKIIRVFTYRDFDPARAGGLDFLTAGGGWLWFLDNGYPFSGVLRVSQTSGRPAGGVPIPPASCGQVVCSQIFYTP
ncbi:MAG: hypothetical protein LBV34_07295, partial [Nocardiopsaceae bacterium]|nr:hypothetical protein [Nocardiopsaceae bacterium]